MTGTELYRPSAPAQTDSGSWFDLGGSLGSALSSVGVSRAAVGTALLLGTALLAGCSPGEKSYMFGSYTELPPPPADARLQLGISTEGGSGAYINYVVWDGGSQTFIRKDIHYTNGVTTPGTFSERGGYKQEIADGEVLYGGAMVDQSGGKIILADGKYIDGPTGDVYSADGTLLKDFKPAAE